MRRGGLGRLELRRTAGGEADRLQPRAGGGRGGGGRAWPGSAANLLLGAARGATRLVGLDEELPWDLLRLVPLVAERGDFLLDERPHARAELPVGVLVVRAAVGGVGEGVSRSCRDFLYQRGASSRADTASVRGSRAFGEGGWSCVALLCALGTPTRQVTTASRTKERRHCRNAIQTARKARIQLRRCRLRTSCCTAASAAQEKCRSCTRRSPCLMRAALRIGSAPVVRAVPVRVSIRDELAVRLCVDRHFSTQRRERRSEARGDAT